MKYKAILTDVDGTLVPNKLGSKPSQKVIQAITNAQIPIGIATARSYWQVVDILDSISFSGPCIITGGAQIIDPKTRKTFLQYTISENDIKKVAHIAKSLDITLTIANREGEFAYRLDTIPSNPLDIYTNPITHNQAHEFSQKISHIETISWHKTLAWGDDNNVHITISHPKASKQEGVLKVANILGINPQEIIAVGEGYNDFPFLMACGLKVAMGNAVDEVKAIADYIAPSVIEDGLADVIEKFI